MGLRRHKYNPLCSALSRRLCRRGSILRNSNSSDRMPKPHGELRILRPPDGKSLSINPLKAMFSNSILQPLLSTPEVRLKVNCPNMATMLEARCTWRLQGILPHLSVFRTQTRLCCRYQWTTSTASSAQSTPTILETSTIWCKALSLVATAILCQPILVGTLLP